MLALQKPFSFVVALTIGVVASCMFGFPTTVILAEEISMAMGRTEEEVAILKGYLVPKMLIAGLLMVTLVSGMVASMLVKFI